MFAAPILTGGSAAALHFVENQQHLVLVADAAQRLEPFLAEMIVAAFALDRLDDDGRDLVSTFGDELHNLRFRFFLARDHIRFALRFA